MNSAGSLKDAQFRRRSWRYEHEEIRDLGFVCGGVVLSLICAFPQFQGTACRAAEKADETTGPPGERRGGEKIEWLVFSLTEHQSERQAVAKHEGITRKQARIGEIYIAPADLNDDGVQEVFAYWSVEGSCGSMGCPFAIYRTKGGRLESLLGSEFDPGGFPIFIDIDKEGRQRVFGVLQSKTMGWHDIALQDEKLWRWRWKGKQYGGAEPLH